MIYINLIYQTHSMSERLRGKERKNMYIILYHIIIYVHIIHKSYYTNSSSERLQGKERKNYADGKLCVCVCVQECARVYVQERECVRAPTRLSLSLTHTLTYTHTHTHTHTIRKTDGWIRMRRRKESASKHSSVQPSLHRSVQRSLQPSLLAPQSLLLAV